MSVVRGVLLAAGGVPVPNVKVSARLVVGPRFAGGLGFLTGGNVAYGSADVLTDGSGAWVLELAPNGSIAAPAGSFYELSASSGGVGQRAYFVVPPGAGPHDIDDLVVASPVPPGWVPLVGPAGSPGPPGVSGGSYTHTQSVLAASWVVVHNLGYRPNVQVFDAAGDYVVVPVAHSSADSVTLTFSVPTSGVAHLS